MQANSTKKYTEIPHFCKELEEMFCSNRILRYSYANSEKCMLSYNGALEQSILFWYIYTLENVDQNQYTPIDSRFIALQFHNFFFGVQG